MNMPKHIIASYDKDLKKLKKMIRQMAALADKQIARTSKAIRKGDEAIANKVVSKDIKLNVLEQELMEEVTRILALRQPKAGDLRTVMAAMKIASSLERIGDHSKNTARRAIEVDSSPALEAVTGNIKRMSKQVRKMLTDVVTAYEDGSVELAEEVRRRDQKVNLMHNSMLREMLTHMMENPANITPGTHLLFVGKNLERIGDLVANIAEQVIYIQTAQLPGDLSDYVALDKTPAVADDVDEKDFLSTEES